ncbi:hypothetical protein L6164_007145 [Bauhinia variegata]|uniref:Uncharacterized protein n=1 Tax=Bauhinia variegata TaxID=167791 RepID=A0ACB9PWL5_BAUVA|nr:hypothetical protein L6164_007145 [Bauhinia variegata]
MADHHEPLFEHVPENFNEGKSSSSSDSDDYKSSPVKVPLKSEVNRLFGRDKPVHKVLGGGQPANIFLWRNRKKSAKVLGGATAMWFLFELLQYHFITLVCHMLILFLAALFFLSNASVFLGRGPPKVPQVVISDKCITEIVSALNIEINRAFVEMRHIASGKDLKKFLSVIAALWVIAGIGKWFNFLTLLYICVLLLFTLPVGYEKYEDQVDSFAEKAMIEIKKQYKVVDAQVLSKISKGAVKKD